MEEVQVAVMRHISSFPKSIQIYKFQQISMCWSGRTYG